MHTLRRSVPVFPLLLVVPFADASATDGFVGFPIPDDAIPLSSIVIEYAGRVSAVSDAPEYSVGDRLAGRLLIDLSVPWSINPDTPPNQRTYTSADPAFVRGFWIPGGDGFDTVFVGNDVARPGDDRPADIFGVRDLYVVQNGSLDGARRFNLTATLYDLIDDARLEQSFEVTSADANEPNESLSGRIMFSSIGPFPSVDVDLDWLSVKPGSCFAR